MKPQLLILVFLLALSQTPYAQTVKKSNLQKTKVITAPPILTTGGTAYFRIKRYFAQMDTVPPHDPTRGYILKGLNIETKGGGDISDKVGYMLKDMPQTQNEKTIIFQYGDNVTLVQKSEGTPTFWLVNKGQTKAWIPSYVLTANKTEIAFLEANHKIPETMTFIYGSDFSVWGISTMPIMGDFYAAIFSRGMSLIDFKKGTSPVAFEGNAVVFDSTAASSLATLGKPLVFAGSEVFTPSPNCLYYCVSDGDKPAFDCIDLISLKFIK